MVVFLDLFFLTFHTGLIGFVLFGWLIRRMQRIHLMTCGLILLSWVGLGFWYGFGYCPCTDWHWQVRTQLGDQVLPNSYIKFLLDRLTGLNWPAQVVDEMTLALFLHVALLSLILVVTDGFRMRRE